ncbi:5-deoxy-glucuronate isomerase [Cohnella sp. JJ-181]|uniref:5-deoxy-glucuronate isomerase n=1 Tax=Cohnella rhizoplanae TaxID=2974897 RepID=UPI0022FF818D|nr:5-deoxy-glucuronate isomerase [Cohnella sp. JJ-181]CAI6040625.1 5-deoxy-glucuronate isomerase [Cohnella sp. JJ-181]
MSELIVRPAASPDADGRLLSVTPASAGWSYVGFEAYRLEPGAALSRETEDKEYCLVLLSGRASVATADGEWTDIGGRMDVFEGTPPYSVYVPAGNRFAVEALTPLELALCAAPGREGRASRLIAPSDVGAEVRGSGVTQRYIHNILPESEPADSLLVVEVFTPQGHWSSYPPHKHDRDALPDESLLEETYYYRVKPEQGFAVQRVYTDDRSLDETLAVGDGQAVLVPKGYHPVSAPPGYEVYYLNVMAGPERVWRFYNDPDHAWIVKKA